MKTLEIRVPKLGMDTTEALIAAWLVQEGARVASGTPLVDLESEKVTFAVESEAAGMLVKIVHPAGATVPVGDLLGLLEVSSDVD